ncbi:MAG: hypothetical protein HY925_07125 [Elusimicrobia bacterium]|nr:hypothetical protein [Elusimicrobiota bacterium]
MKRRSLLEPGERSALAAAAAVSAAVFLLGLKLSPARAWTDLLLFNVYFLGPSAAALAFIAIQYVAGAGWPTLFRRVPEAMTAYLVPGAALIAALLAGSHQLYHWAHAEAIEHDAVLRAKAGWLNLNGWTVRSALALGLWWAFGRAIVLNSRRQDVSGDAALTLRNRGLSAAFLVAYGITFTFASIDWVMSLEPHWYSTMFPWYLFGGCFVQAIAGITLLTLALRRRGLFEELNAHHLHDLGKYLFAFSVFWAYLWFSQFLLIWYSNIPEESAYYAARLSRSWMTLQAANLVLNFVAPFVLLLRASAKKRPGLLAAAALVICAGRALDLYIMTVPALGTGARPHWLEPAVGLGLGALFLLAFDRAFGAAGPVPVKDPYLVESLHHHGG